MKVERADHTSRHESTKKKKICKDSHKKHPTKPKNQANSYDACICINIKKKTLLVPKAQVKC